MDTNIDNHSRFKDAEWYGEALDIIIGGVGGIGSWVAFFLGRIGHNLFLYDMDSIEKHNLGGQLYEISQVGINKAVALSNIIRRFSDHLNVECEGEFTKDSDICPIVFSCFDNMKARKIMFEAWKAQEDREIFIDGRMLAETGMVYTVLKGQEERYEATLFDDDEVEDVQCSFKATSHSGGMIGSLMVSVFNNYLVNKKANEDIRDVPFKIDYILPLIYFDTEK